MYFCTVPDTRELQRVQKEKQRWYFLQEKVLDGETPRVSVYGRNEKPAASQVFVVSRCPL